MCVWGSGDFVGSRRGSGGCSSGVSVSSSSCNGRGVTLGVSDADVNSYTSLFFYIYQREAAKGKINRRKKTAVFVSLFGKQITQIYHRIEIYQLCVWLCA